MLEFATVLVSCTHLSFMVRSVVIFSMSRVLYFTFFASSERSAMMLAGTTSRAGAGTPASASVSVTIMSI